METMEVNELLGELDKIIEKSKELGISDREEVLAETHTALDDFFLFLKKYSADPKICEYKIDTSHLKKMGEATNLPFLLIFESKSEIYFYLNMKKFFNDTLERFIKSTHEDLKDPTNKNREQEKIKENLEAVLKNLKDECIYKQSINELNVSGAINNLLKCLNDFDENKVKNQGSELKGRLIPLTLTELKSENDETKDIWIFCEKKDIDYHWEWIYWVEEHFFLGDRFNIVRIPENCHVKKLKLQIDKFTFLIEKPCHPAKKRCTKAKKHLYELLGKTITCEKLIVNSPKKIDYSNLDASDCIHVGGYGETFEEKLSDYRTALRKKIELNTPKFIFLNMFPKKNTVISTHSQLSKEINAFTPTIFVDSSLNVPESFASVFVECFYEKFKKHLEDDKEVNIVEIFLKTREEIEKMENQGDHNTFWKFAYVVIGNPSTILTSPKTDVVS